MLDYDQVTLKRTKFVLYLKLKPNGLCHAYIPSVADVHFKKYDHRWIVHSSIKNYGSSLCRKEMYEAVDKYANNTLSKLINKEIIS